jgi:hypothetical protein
MHHKYEKKGVVVISVSTDEIDKDIEDRTPVKVIERVRSFVKKRQAPFDTLILDEPFEVIDSKLHFLAPPCVFVFNRQGKWRQLVPESPKDPNLEIYNGRIEKTVTDLLDEK